MGRRRRATRRVGSGGTTRKLLYAWRRCVRKRPARCRRRSVSHCTRGKRRDGSALDRGASDGHSPSFSLRPAEAVALSRGARAPIRWASIVHASRRRESARPIRTARGRVARSLSHANPMCVRCCKAWVGAADRRSARSGVRLARPAGGFSPSPYRPPTRRPPGVVRKWCAIAPEPGNLRRWRHRPGVVVG